MLLAPVGRKSIIKKVGMYNIFKNVKADVQFGLLLLMHFLSVKTNFRPIFCSEWELRKQPLIYYLGGMFLIVRITA